MVPVDLSPLSPRLRRALTLELPVLGPTGEPDQHIPGCVERIGVARSSVVVNDLFGDLELVTAAACPDCFTIIRNKDPLAAQALVLGGAIDALGDVPTAAAFEAARDRVAECLEDSPQLNGLRATASAALTHLGPARRNWLRSPAGLEYLELWSSLAASPWRRDRSLWFVLGNVTAGIGAQPRSLSARASDHRLEPSFGALLDFHQERIRPDGRILVSLTGRYPEAPHGLESLQDVKQKTSDGTDATQGLLLENLVVHRFPGAPDALVLPRSLEPLVRRYGSWLATSVEVAKVKPKDDAAVLETAAQLAQDGGTPLAQCLVLARALA